LRTGILTDELPGAAVYIEWIVTDVVVGVAVLEEEAIGAEFGLGHAVHAFVVQVALLKVGEKPIWLGARKACK